MNFQNISATATCSQIAKVHVFCFTVFWVTHLLISCCGLQNLETFPVSSPALSLLKHSFDIWTNWEWLTCKTCSWWRHSKKSWYLDHHQPTWMLRCFKHCKKNVHFCPPEHTKVLLPMHRWQMDGFQDCPQLAICHFAYFAILPFCPLMQMVNLGPNCVLSNYNFLIGLQIKSAPQTIMGIVRVKLSILTWHHYILTEQKLM